MDYRALTLADRVEWARLLSDSFGRTQEQMEQLIAWFHAGFPLVTWGAWDGDRLVAQYNCRILRINVPGNPEPALAGMGLNMAVDADYRGRGLLESVATPVHEMIKEQGCIAGVGFSSHGGLAVTRKSSSYAYRVLGPMTSSLVILSRRSDPQPILLTDTFPDGRFTVAPADAGLVSYAATAASIRHRFAEHPFRRYRFGVWQEGEAIRGLVVFRPARLRGLSGIALLAAYGEDLPDLLGRWAGAVQRSGVRFIHIVTSPASPLRGMLRYMGLPKTIPFSRDPYHLIARALRDDTPEVLFDLNRWDCIGGDIL